MLNATARRLPGIQFEPRAARLEGALPRMDIAMFVGFAAMGPLNVPVAVEDAAQFRSVFGADLSLARDPVTGEIARALLAPTVRAFFANGGRRCWVVRVASQDARYDHLPLPGLLALAGKLGRWAARRDRAAGASAPACGDVPRQQHPAPRSRSAAAGRR